MLASLLLSALVSSAPAMADQPQPPADSVLLITMERFSYDNNKGSTTPSVDLKQNFKIVLNADFKAQFKNLDSTDGHNTLLACGGGDTQPDGTGVGFAVFFGPTATGAIRAWGWGEGAETINGTTISLHNGDSTANVTFPNWESANLGQSLSVVNQYAGVNVGYSYKVVPSNDPQVAGAKLVKITAQYPATGNYIEGDSLTGSTLTFGCGLQMD